MLWQAKATGNVVDDMTTDRPTWVMKVQKKTTVYDSRMTDEQINLREVLMDIYTL
jgi:hypothetical protein